MGETPIATLQCGRRHARDEVTGGRGCRSSLATVTGREFGWQLGRAHVRTRGNPGLQASPAPALFRENPE
jgi:hypothetical protein